MEESSDIVHIEGRVIATFAAQHLRAAALFRDHATQIETAHNGKPLGPFFEDIRSYVVACIMSSATSLETLISELFLDPQGQLRTKYQNFETDFWGKKQNDGIQGKGTINKFKEALTKLNLPSLDETTPTYKNANNLISLRHKLVHYKPTWDPYRQDKATLSNELRGKFSESPFVDSGADFISMKCMSANCASWAIQSVIDFVLEFQNRANFDNKKINGFVNAGR